MTGGAPLIVKLGGAAVDNARAMPRLWRALAELHESELEAGRGVAIVHGGGAAVDRLFASLGLPVVRHEGFRVTPPDQIDHVVGVLGGSVNTALVGALADAGANPVGLSLGDGGLAKARAVSPALGRVGEVTGGDPVLIRTLWGAGYLPVVSSIAADDEGAALNVNADDAAGALGRIVGARAVVFLTDVAGVLSADGTVISSLTFAEASALIESGAITGGMIAKVRAAMRAVEGSGGGAGVIASWNDPDALDSLADGRRAGTTIVADSPMLSQRS